MKRTGIRWAVLALVAGFVARTVVPACAADDEGFYRGRTITIIIGNSAGGLYDLTGRLLARHMGRHIPGNPTMIAQNMPGAGSESAIAYLYNVAPKDGTALGVVSRGWAVEPILTPGMPYDPRRFNWIGSLSDEVSLAVVWHTSVAQKFEDLMTHQIAVGGTAQGADNNRIPLLLNNMLGAKIKLINGYPGGNDITNAMEKGEVDGYFAWSWGAVKSRGMDWLKSGKIRILFQAATHRAVDLPEVPSILDFARTDEDRQVIQLLFEPLSFAWPMLAPPSMPADRVAMLRRAYAETMQDPALIADAKKLSLEVHYMAGADINAAIDKLYAIPPEIVKKALAYTAK